MSRFDDILRGSLYRSRQGIILGVCRGIAEYFNFSVFWTRAIAVIIFFFSGFWPIMAIYFIAGLLMKPEPIRPFDNNDEREFYNDYVHRRQSSIERIKRRYQNLERRIQRVEHRITSKEYDWDNRFKSSDQESI